MLLELFLEYDINTLKSKNLGGKKTEQDILKKIKDKAIFYTTLYNKIIKQERHIINNLINIDKIKESITPEMTEKEIKKIIKENINPKNIEYYIVVVKGKNIYDIEEKIMKEKKVQIKNIPGAKLSLIDYDYKNDVLNSYYNNSNIELDKNYILFYVKYKNVLYRIEYYILDYFYNNIFTLNKNNIEILEELKKNNTMEEDSIKIYSNKIEKEKEIIKKIKSVEDIKEAFINIYTHYINKKIRNSWENNTIVNFKKTKLNEINNILKKMNKSPIDTIDIFKKMINLQKIEVIDKTK